MANRRSFGPRQNVEKLTEWVQRAARAETRLKKKTKKDREVPTKKG
jgi:hypothetical protein